MNSFIKMLFTFIVALVVITGCSNEEDKIPSQSTIEFEKNGQGFKVIPLYEEFLDYADEATEDSSKNNKGEFYSKVTQPFLNSASEENAILSGGLDYSQYFYPTGNAQALKENTNELLMQQNEINNIIKESLVKAATKLPGGEKTIFVRPIDPQVSIIKQMNGVAAITLSKDAIVIMLDPSFEKEMLKYVIAHEYHHSVFFEDSENDYSLLNGIIFEGKAESFASRLYPDVSVPWSEPMSSEEEKVVLEEVKSNVDSRSTDIYSQFQNGNVNKDIPRWSNYKIGFKITESYITNHPELSIRDWTVKSGEEIVHGSHFSEILRN
ncbi:DUF2268 domain-containing protein [Guptibacillus hwajinpoensis]|uniref:DUF2268 domain-containing protein n=1 Tax=Guptibacillus hwajinpoensis TaxID=208199 RepID=A0A0J6D2D3_9BACL|nr:DUF2268 domain-containing putative Zn-dependent protease [Alkalihalobacillus macyae]KMM38459.1 hypothetical protein AB986_03950 [Alkalihalobacillus macyae]